MLGSGCSSWVGRVVNRCSAGAGTLRAHIGCERGGNVGRHGLRTGGECDPALKQLELETKGGADLPDSSPPYCEPRT